MKKILLVLGLLFLSGCMTPIGEPEFTCPNEKKGGACAGPRDIYELTNTRENLENLHKEAAFKNKTIKDEDGHIIAVNYHQEKDDLEKEDVGLEKVRHSIKQVNNEDKVYEPREPSQQTSENYQPAKEIKATTVSKEVGDKYQRWPSNIEALAPEPLAVLSAPKVMRILIASYKDANGHLNMPGYVYVQVEPEVWSVGEAANLRPTRVVPLQIRDKSQEEENKRKHKSKGVSALEHWERGQ